MKLVFNPDYPPEQLTVEFWQAEFASAHAEWLLHEMDRGRIAPPGAYRSEYVGRKNRR